MTLTSLDLRLALVAVDALCHEYEEGDYVIRAVPVHELREVLKRAGLTR